MCFQRKFPTFESMIVFALRDLRFFHDNFGFTGHEFFDFFFKIFTPKTFAESLFETVTRHAASSSNLN